MGAVPNPSRHGNMMFIQWSFIVAILSIVNGFDTRPRLTVLQFPSNFTMSGSTINITCFLKEKFYPEYGQDTLVISHRMIPLTEHLTYGNHSLTVTLYNVTQPRHGGTYKCKPKKYPYDAPRRELIIADPVDFTKVKVKCFIKDFSSLNCTWHPYRYMIPINWTAYTTLDRSEFSCPKYGSTRSTLINNTCLWNEEHAVSSLLHLTLVAKTELETVKYSYQFEKFKIVHLSPVRKMLVDCKAANVTLSWMLHSHPGFAITVVSNTTMKSRWGTSYDIRSFNLRGDEDTVRYTIMDLIPATLYTLSVSVRVTESTYWSHPASITATTEPDVPGASPVMSAGSFTQHSADVHQNSRVVTLYWKELEEIERYGNITYVVAIPGANQTTDSTQIDLTLLTDTSYNIKVAATNAIGLSHENSFTTIPKFDDVPPMPDSVGAVQHNKTHVELVWRLPHRHTFTNVTVHSCYGSVIKPDQVIAQCRADYNFVVLSNYEKTSFISRSMATHGGYSYGVSIETADAGSSGIKWALCVNERGGIPGKPDTLIAAGSSDHSVTVTWQAMGCTRVPGIVLNYTLNYYPAHSSLTCDTGTTITLDPDIQTYTITSLHTDTEYEVCLRAVSTHGVGPWSDSIAISTKRAPLLSVAGVVGIITALLILIALLILTLKCCRRKPAKLLLNIPPLIGDGDYVDMYPEHLAAEVYDRPPVNSERCYAPLPLLRRSQDVYLKDSCDEVMLNDIQQTKQYNDSMDSGNDTGSLNSTTSEQYRKLKSFNTHNEEKVTYHTTLSDISDKSNVSSDDHILSEIHHSPHSDKRNFSGERNYPETFNISEWNNFGSQIPSRDNNMSGGPDDTLTPVSPYCLFSSDYTPNCAGETPPSYDSLPNECNSPPILVSDYVTMECE